MGHSINKLLPKQFPKSRCSLLWWVARLQTSEKEVHFQGIMRTEDAALFQIERVLVHKSRNIGALRFDAGK